MAVAAYLSAHAPPAVGTIGGRRRIVTRRRQRPRRIRDTTAEVCSKATYILRVVSRYVRPRRRLCCAVRLAGHRVAADRFNVSRSTIIAAAPCFHIVLFPPHDGAALPPAPAACCSDANGLHSPASAPRLTRLGLRPSHRRTRRRCLLCLCACACLTWSRYLAAFASHCGGYRLVRYSVTAFRAFHGRWLSPRQCWHERRPFAKTATRQGRRHIARCVCEFPTLPPPVAAAASCGCSRCWLDARPTDSRRNRRGRRGRHRDASSAPAIGQGGTERKRWR
jgi:hypothetical protein